MDYVDRIIQALKKKGKTQRGLAKALGIHPTHVNKIIKRKRQLQAHEWQDTADYLDMTVNELVSGGKSSGDTRQLERAFDTKLSVQIYKVVAETPSMRNHFEDILNAVHAANPEPNLESIPNLVRMAMAQIEQQAKTQREKAK